MVRQLFIKFIQIKEKSWKVICFVHISFVLSHGGVRKVFVLFFVSKCEVYHVA